MVISIHHRQTRLKVAIPDSATVVDLKLKVYSLSQILPRNQKLFFKGTQVSVIHLQA